VTKVVTAAQMRALEEAAVARGATWDGLMEQAGAGVAAEAKRLLEPGAGALVLAGPGNNGGDGLVVARHLHTAGHPVVLYLWRRRDDPHDMNLRLCRELGIPELRAEDDPERAELRRRLAEAELVVDALLGAGMNRPVTGDLAAIVEVVRAGARRVLAVDIPTGVDSETGQILGTAIQADLTAATGLLKRGLLLGPGRAAAGALRTIDIGLPPKILEDVMSELINTEYARATLPARPADGHKYTFGKALVVAGSPQYPGAASLATAGAARVGAGLVCLATGRSAAGGPGRLPEIIYMLLPEAEWGALGEAAADELLQKLGDYKSLLVGPGLGREQPTRRFLERLLNLDAPRRRSRIGFRIGAPDEPDGAGERPELPPTVLDADALTLLSQHAGDESAHRGDFFQRSAPASEEPAGSPEQWWEQLPRGRVILTPHAGEMARLLGVEKIDADHVQVAEQAAKRWGQIVILKGPTTVVAHPEGRTLLHDGANPALATAGTGDVLAGAITGLLAQGLEPFDAAALGVYLHGAAGRVVREELGDAGALASDLLPRLPLAIKALRG
jgi:hydroxyethylthiazole kinase-like uncharacterized protein yjeF